MAGNTLTIGARFKPMSYAEMLAPVLAATNEFNIQTDELDKLSLASSVWENMANKETDPIAYLKYTNYANSLKLLADILSSLGLTPNSRKAISQMKGQYQAEILPIELAYKRREEMSKNYEKARMQNPTLMSNIDPSKLSLDKLIANPSLTPEYYSGNLLAEQVANKAKSVASEMLSTGKWTSTAGGQRLERIVKNGFSAQDVALAQSGKGPQELQDLVNNVIKSSPISSWENSALLLPQAYLYAASGLYAGIGKKDIESSSDQSYLTPIQRHLINKDNQATALANAKLKDENSGRPLSWETLGNIADAKNSPVVKQFNKDKLFIEKWRTTPNFLNNTTIKEESPIMYMGDAKGEIFTLPGKLSRISVNPNRALAQELFKKYGTHNLSEIINKIDKGIKTSTSTFRETAIKTLNNSNINTLLFDQLSSDSKTREGLIKTSEGKKLKPEEIANVFNLDGRLTYSPETKQLGMINSKHKKDTRFILDRNVISNIDVPVGVDSKGNKQVVSSNDYLNYIDSLYAKNPEDPKLNTLIGNFYDAIDTYSKTFNQSAPTSSSKEIINEI